MLALYGAQCDVILLTDGSKGGDRSKPEETRRIREAEFAEVMAFFGVRSYQFMRAKDGDLIEAYDLFKKLDFTGYDYVFMPHPSDSHKDHVAVPALFARLCRENRRIKAKPAFSAAADRKREAMALYRSQGNIDYAGRILGLNHYRGIRHNVTYEEDFTLG